MGVRGLTLYIDRNSHKYLKLHKLHDCYLIIDGASLTYSIYTRFSSNVHQAFGGDYDRFAQSLRDFFVMLSKCNVTPIVLLDGRYEQRKVTTVMKRMVRRTFAMKAVLGGSSQCGPVHPLFMKYILKEVMRELDIPFAQCDCEADQEIASLAHKYDYPVLGNDSDYYIYGVSYIPISTLQYEALSLGPSDENSDEKFYIHCKIYKTDVFFKSFGGLDSSMLPLLSSILGNDYVRIKEFKDIVSQFKVSKGKRKGKANRIEKRIYKVIQWLRNETFNSAVNRILSKVKSCKHRSLLNGIKASVSAYTHANCSVEAYLPLQLTKAIPETPIEPDTDCDMLNVDDSQDDVPDDDNQDEMDVDNEEDDHEDDSSEASDDSDAESSDNELLNKMIVQSKSTKNKDEKKYTIIPQWLLDSSRKGDIEPCALDIMILKKYFTVSQVEDDNHPSSHACSIGQIKKIAKLLLGDCLSVHLWMKNQKGHVQGYTLHLRKTPIVTDIAIMPSLSLATKRSILLECLDVPDEFCLDSFPDEWKLFVCAIITWMKSEQKPQKTKSHVLSLLMCAIALSIVDSKVGFYRKKYGFFKKHGKTQKKIINEKGKLSDINKPSKGYNQDDDNSEDETTCEPTTVKDIFSSIDLNDCIASFDEFYRWHVVDETLQNNQKIFCKSIVHAFSQFQSCLYHASILNSLLQFPLERPIISRLFSGTFLYNMCRSLSRVKDINNFIKTLLKHSPKIFELLEAMLSALSTVVDIVELVPLKRNKRKRKKKRSNTVDVDEDTEEDTANNEEVEPPEKKLFFDANNKFSLLSSI